MVDVREAFIFSPKTLPPFLSQGLIFFRKIYVILVCTFVSGMSLSALFLLSYMNEAFIDDFTLLASEKREALFEYITQTIRGRFKSSAYVGKSLQGILEGCFLVKQPLIEPLVIHYLSNTNFLRGVSFINPHGDVVNFMKVNQKNSLFWHFYLKETKQDTAGELPQKAFFAAQLDETSSGGRVTWSFYGKLGTALHTTHTHDPVLSFQEKDAWLEHTKKAGKPELSSPLGFIFGGVGILIIYPIFDNQTRDFLGAISLNIDVEKISNLLESLSIGNVKALFLLNRKGVCLAHSSMEQGLSFSQKGVIPKAVSDLHPSWGPAFRQYQENPDYVWESHDKDSKLFFFPLESDTQGFPFLEDISLGLVCGNDYQRLGFYQSQWEAGLLTLCVIVVVSLLLAQIVLRISRPIESVARSLGEIEQMRFEVSSHKPSYFYEIDRISKAFSGVSRALNAFGKFVPMVLVRQLLGAREEALLGGHEKRVTIMFSDIQDFTSISEKLVPQELVSNLSEYFQACTRIIQDNQGTLDKYIGDAVMAFWGAPLSDSLHIVHACQAVLTCHSHLKQMNIAWEKEDKPPFKSRFGLCTGDVIVGNFGSDERFQYTVIGDSVNLASRLESLNKVYGTKILVDEQTYLGAKDHFVFRVIDRVAVKGKEKGVLVYELLHTREGFSSGGYLSDLALYMEQAFTYYQHQEWSRALKRYRFIYQGFHEDSVASLFVERCEHFLKYPPGKDWDGITRMQKK